jgi:hypothetical protein
MVELNSGSSWAQALTGNNEMAAPIMFHKVKITVLIVHFRYQVPSTALELEKSKSMNKVQTPKWLNKVAAYSNTGAKTQTGHHSRVGSLGKQPWRIQDCQVRTVDLILPTAFPFLSSRPR